MFITVKSHLRILEAYESRIRDLHQQIADLRKLTIPPTTLKVPLVHLEADSVMSAKQEQVEISDQEMREREEENHEASRVLMGTYDYISE